MIIKNIEELRELIKDMRGDTEVKIYHNVIQKDFRLGFQVKKIYR